MAEPFFSVVITAFNRAPELQRCLASVAAQSVHDREVIVVDDGSSDETAEVLADSDLAGLRTVRHPVNRGIAPARSSGIRAARGRWIVLLDSDWALTPTALARLREIIEEMPTDLRIIRSRLRYDDGQISPGVTLDGVVDYESRIRWCEQVAAAGAASDAGHCVHRDVFGRHPYIDDRRGAVETLWELDVARDEPSLWVGDILGLAYTDAANSHVREVDGGRLIPRLRAEAADTQWMVETLLSRHGTVLARLAPHYAYALQESGALQAFLAGSRTAGVRLTLAAARGGVGSRVKLAGTLALGMLGPGAVARAKLLGRRVRTRRDGRA